MRKKRMRYVRVDDAFTAEIVNRSEGKMALKFQAPNLTVTMVLPDHWIGYLAGEFHTHIEKRREELDQISRQLTGASK